MYVFFFFFFLNKNNWLSYSFSLLWVAVLIGLISSVEQLLFRQHFAGAVSHPPRSTETKKSQVVEGRDSLSAAADGRTADNNRINEVKSLGESYAEGWGCDAPEAAGGLGNRCV